MAGSTARLKKVVSKGIYDFQKNSKNLFNALRDADDKKVENILGKCPPDQKAKLLTTVESYVHHRVVPDLPEMVDEKSDTVTFVKTLLHEAIIVGNPESVKTLCRHGADPNFNPMPGSQYPGREDEIKQYSLPPLKVAEDPQLPTPRNTILYQSDIIKFLISQNAKMAGETIPIPISDEELSYLYKYLYNLITTAYVQSSEDSAKAFLIILPELHFSKWSLLLESIVLRIASNLGVKNFYIERSDASLRHKLEHNTFDHNISLDNVERWRTPYYYYTLDTAVPLSCALGMTPIAIDNSLATAEGENLSTPHIKERVDKLRESVGEMPILDAIKMLSDPHGAYKDFQDQFTDYAKKIQKYNSECSKAKLQDREHVMASIINDTNKSGVVSIGRGHTEGILPLLDYKKYHVICINVSPPTPHYAPAYVDIHKHIHQIPEHKGSVECWSPKKIVTQALGCPGPHSKMSVKKKEEPKDEKKTPATILNKKHFSFSLFSSSTKSDIWGRIVDLEAGSDQPAPKVVIKH